MRTWPDCTPCILRMNLEVIRSMVDDEERVAALMDTVIRVYNEESGSASGRGATQGAADEAAGAPARRAPEIIAVIWRELVRLTGDADPMRVVKARQNSLALGLLPAARELVAASPDPFLQAVKLAAAGNVLDVMVGVDETPADELLHGLAGRWVDAEQVERFRGRLRRARRVVYFLDNCGEIVFDRLFLEVVGGHGSFGPLFGDGPPEVTVVARALPVLNDATVADALAVGLDEVAPVIGNGIEEALPGTKLSLISPEVRRLVDEADLVVSKGGANFELLEEEADLRGKVAFLLLGKCLPLCRTLDVPRDGLIVHNA